jgi:hypothetical protein
MTAEKINTSDAINFGRSDAVRGMANDFWKKNALNSSVKAENKYCFASYFMFLSPIVAFPAQKAPRTHKTARGAPLAHLP